MAITVDQFLRNLLRCELVDRDALRDVLRSMPPEARDQAPAVAEFLVAQKMITTFQSHKVLAGVTQGLKLDSYVVQTPIGKGGMGTVYLAKDCRDGKAVAIKVLSPKRAKEGERHLVRFQREMVLSQKLDHDNIARTREVGEFKGVHYLVLEYIPGVTLHRLVTTEGVLTVPRAARLFVEVCDALEYAHAQGLIHRDLKPANIMVTPDDHAKVLDLGLALMIGEEIEDSEIVGGKGYVVGSVDFIAPEQTKDPTQVDGRADLYALGCTLYFALSGKSPFSATTLKDKIKAHRRLEAEPLSSRNPKVPDGLSNLVARMMAKKPDQRPASAAIVRQELLVYSEADADLKSPESIVYFELVNEHPFEEGSDTLSEAFADPTRGSDSPIFSADVIRGIFRKEKSRAPWIIAGAVTLVILIVVAIVVVRMTQR